MRTSPRKAIRQIPGVGNVQTAMVAVVELKTVEGWLDMQQACAYLGCGRTMIYKMLKSGALPERRLNGGELKFRREDLDKCMLTPVEAMNRMSKS